jgi:hypothetical protein
MRTPEDGERQAGRRKRNAIDPRLVIACQPTGEAFKNPLPPQSGVAKKWRHFWNKNGDSF